MAQGWLNTCGIAMPLHNKAIYLQWCLNDKKKHLRQPLIFPFKNYNSHSKKGARVHKLGGEHPVAVYST
jgi:hypothetical protein